MSGAWQQINVGCGKTMAEKKLFYDTQNNSSQKTFVHWSRHVDVKVIAFEKDRNANAWKLSPLKISP